LDLDTPRGDEYPYFLSKFVKAAQTLEVISRPYISECQAVLTKLTIGITLYFRMACYDYKVMQGYRHAISMALPSLYRDCYGNETRIPEVLGQTLLKGMACRTPGFCTQVASLPEVVENIVFG
jgi:hypothetical protein